MLVACGRCGADTGSGDKFCRKCGTTLLREADFRLPNTGQAFPSHFPSGDEESVGSKSAISEDTLAQPKSERSPKPVVSSAIKGWISPSPITTTKDQDAAKLNVLVQRTRELEGEVAGLRDQLWRAKGRPSKLVAMILFLVGSITLVSSAVYDVIVLAFIGMGLTFWGALLLQIRPARFVHAEIVGSTAQSMMIAIDRLVGEQDNVGKAMYLPGDDLGTTTVFLPLYGRGPAPTTHLDWHYSTRGQKGMNLVPPGLSLASLLDQQIGNISKGGVATLADRLTRVLTESLGIANHFEMRIQKDHIQVKLQDAIYSELYDELRESTKISSSLGCPICSAIACLLANTTSRPVTFEGETLSKNGRMMESNYQILSESSNIAGSLQTESQNHIMNTPKVQ